jgi:electron transfer flavoprotein beta subunit
VHVLDDALRGSCALATARVLAALVDQERPDLVLCGAESTDGGVAALPQMIAERLGIAALTGARRLTVEGGSVTVERQTEAGYAVLAAQLPAIVSVWDTINQPRYPTLKGIMAAKRRPVRTVTLAELGIPAAEVGAGAASSVVLSHAPRPARQAGNAIADDGDGGDAIVGFLASRKLI